MVRVFVLGGTGSIGSAVVRELIARGHDVIGLARSKASAATLRQYGATPLAGDTASPERWAGSLPRLDAVIHMACDFETDMAAIDRRLLDVLLPALATQPVRPRFIYTGGGWLFGDTGELATETTPLQRRPPSPGWSHSLRACSHRMTSTASSSTRQWFTNPRAASSVALRERQSNVTRSAWSKSEAVRWPLVHTDDIASLYALALERAPKGSSYIGAAIEALAVGRIARAFAKHFRTRQLAPEIISTDAIAAELGEWARGFARDQRLSGAKARRELGWQPKYVDPEREIAELA